MPLSPASSRKREAEKPIPTCRDRQYELPSRALTLENAGR
jgi:hypothetical protein